MHYEESLLYNIELAQCSLLFTVFHVQCGLALLHVQFYEIVLSLFFEKKEKRTRNTTRL